MVPADEMPGKLMSVEKAGGRAQRSSMRTQVGIVGGGPSGLLLARLLALAGIDSVVLERRTPEYLRARIRAGLLEQGTVDLLTDAGLGERLARERLIHDGVELAFDGRRLRIDLEGALRQGRHHLRPGRDPEGPDGRARGGRHADRLRGRGRQPARPHRRRARACATARAAQSHEIDCDFIAGCDGFHGVSRQASRRT